jgi:uncharacterized OB-fold protein
MPADIVTLNPDPWTEPFWDAARRHELVAARCVNCSTFRPMPPGPFCWNCSVQEVEWIQLPGTGEVHTFTIVRDALMPSMAEVVPFVIAVVSLDGVEGVRLMTNVVGIDWDQVEVGLRVQVAWDDVSHEVTIPRFTPADSEEEPFVS